MCSPCEAALQSAEPARTVGHKMCRTALAVLLLCAAAARSAELTVSPAYADVRGGQPLLLTLPSGTRWDLEEPHCLIGAPAALRAHSAAALPAHGSRAAACEPSAPEAQGGWHGGGSLPTWGHACRTYPLRAHHRRSEGGGTPTPTLTLTLAPTLTLILTLVWAPQAIRGWRHPNPNPNSNPSPNPNSNPNPCVGTTGDQMVAAPQPQP